MKELEKKTIEKHITVTEPVHNKLRSIAKKENRTMRAVTTRLIDAEFNKSFKKDSL